MSDNSEWARLVELDMSGISGHEAEHLRSEILRLQSELSEAKARVEEARDGALREAREICQSELEDCETEAERQRCLSIATACLHMMSEEGDDPDEDALIKPMSKESYAECMRIATIADAQPAAEARATAIEECAKVAEAMHVSPVYYVNGQPNAQPIIGGHHIATAIRSLNGGKTE